jgi:chromosome segregation ATPase
LIWKEFVGYVKSRDKKVKDLEGMIKKKEKDLTQKDKLVGVLQESLKETETVFLSMQGQVKKFADFITNTEKELQSLAEKNVSLKSEFEQEKILINYKLKAEGEAKHRMEEKMKYYEQLEEQIKEVRRVSQETELSYETWIIEQ